MPLSHNSLTPRDARHLIHLHRDDTLLGEALQEEKIGEVDVKIRGAAQPCWLSVDAQVRAHEALECCARVGTHFAGRLETYGP